MAEGQFKEGIAGGRLSPAEYADNFSDLHPPLDHHEALVESDRCYFCYDAPCMKACPTSIDIPMFIREISTGNPLGSAKTIFDQNILGGMCARVCPTETLCEEVCVREVAEGKPVQIGRLQRYATDIAMGEGKQFYKRAALDRPQGRRGRRRPGRPRRRAPAGAPWPRRDDLRGAAEIRRPQRVRHRRLQEHRRFRAGRGRLRHRRSAASRSRTARRWAAISSSPISTAEI